MYMQLIIAVLLAAAMNCIYLPLQSERVRYVCIRDKTRHELQINTKCVTLHMRLSYPLYSSNKFLALYFT